ncbi:hypothetical protein UVI_02058850 [Ustilaginoidea virens]|uniref:Uncharacterized protein n=1 Tax=Ustilaginoidea virens TaxID=1159556 RepID=A0A1B5L5W9_USTVR|nr:hypothetical protein UVI_02058850 [Ustilaginoidea virens]
MAVAVCTSVVQGKRSDMTSLAGVPETEANVGGVAPPMAGVAPTDMESDHAPGDVA